MVKKRLLTIDDLVQFCRENNFARFSSKESGYKLAVQVPTTFEIENSTDDNHRGMLKLKFRLFHEGLNRNRSYVSHDAAVKASATISDRPIMAAIHQLDDGTWDFESHEMEIVENENGEHEINYIEKQVGSFSSEKPFWEHDDALDKDYVCAYGYIAEEYTKASDIIREKNGTKNSCELSIDELAYNAKENYLDLKSFYVAGSTLLGKRKNGDEIQEGMIGSRADIVSFSAEQNSVLSNDKQLIELLSELNKKLDSFNISNSERKEENRMKKDFEEEEITSEESTEDTPLQDATADFEETPKKKKSEDDGSEILIDKDDESDDDDDQQQDDNDSDDQQDDDNKDDDQKDDDDSEDEPEEPTEPEVTDTQSAEDNGADAEDPEDVNYYSIDYTVNVNGEKKEFSVSLKEKLNALTTLVNDTYGELDGAWFDCDVIEDSKIVEFHDWWANKHYRQSYAVKKDVYSLVGDRVETFMLFATADEKKQLEQMKANYSSIEEKLQQYEAEPEKLEVFANTDYDQIRDTDAFKELSKRESYFAMSKEEITEKLDSLLLDFAKSHKIEFSSAENEQKPMIGIKLFGNPSKKSTGTKSRYGGIFSK